MKIIVIALLHELVHAHAEALEDEAEVVRWVQEPIQGI